jgi:hypothetical protein
VLETVAGNLIHQREAVPEYASEKTRNGGGREEEEGP